MKKKLKQEKELFLEVTTTLYKKLKNWKKIKPISGLIEDFFKVCKDAFGLGKFHSFTQKSMLKTSTYAYYYLINRATRI